jgi:hypothetical protein
MLLWFRSGDADHYKQVRKSERVFADLKDVIENATDLSQTAERVQVHIYIAARNSIRRLQCLSEARCTSLLS